MVIRFCAGLSFLLSCVGFFFLSFFRARFLSFVIPFLFLSFFRARFPLLPFSFLSCRTLSSFLFLSFVPGFLSFFRVGIFRSFSCQVFFSFLLLLCRARLSLLSSFFLSFVPGCPVSFLPSSVGEGVIVHELRPATPLAPPRSARSPSWCEQRGAV